MRYELHEIGSIETIVQRTKHSLVYHIKWNHRFI